MAIHYNTDLTNCIESEQIRTIRNKMTFNLIDPQKYRKYRKGINSRRFLSIQCLLRGLLLSRDSYRAKYPKSASVLGVWNVESAYLASTNLVLHFVSTCLPARRGGILFCVTTTRHSIHRPRAVRWW